MNDNSISRRCFVGGVAITCACLSTGASLTWIQQAAAETIEEGVQYGFWVDSVRCDGCGECVKACREENGFTEEEGSNRTVQELFNAFGDGRYISTSCMHCSDPSCARVCPAGAIEKRGDGIVAVNHDRCIGCKYCYQACPFEVPRYTKAGMVKCDCCLGAGIRSGDTPNCVKACKSGALRYGNVEDLVRLSGGRAQFIQASTGPNCLFS